MKLKIFQAGPMANLSYLVENEKTKQCFLVDPAWDLKAVLKFCKEAGLEICAAVLTHGHFDHSQGIEALPENVPLYLEAGDKEMLPDLAARLKTFRGDTKLKLAGFEVSVLHTPGHSEGSVCLLLEKNLFTGDTLFVGGCGRVDLKEGDPAKMRESLLLLSKLPPEIKIFPGHGQDEESTIGQERETNHYMRLAVKSRADFLKEML